MENVSQALLTAAGILIGILILSLGVYLFYTLGGFAANTQNEIQNDRLVQFNSEFLKYESQTNLTIQDVITVKNYALENNNQYTNYNSSIHRANDNNEYVDVYLNGNIIFDKKDENLLKQEMGKKFTCKVEISTNTGRVGKVYFSKTQ